MVHVFRTPLRYRLVAALVASLLAVQPTFAFDADDIDDLEPVEAERYLAAARADPPPEVPSRWGQTLAWLGGPAFGATAVLLWIGFRGGGLIGAGRDLTSAESMVVGTLASAGLMCVPTAIWLGVRRSRAIARRTRWESAHSLVHVFVGSDDRRAARAEFAIATTVPALAEAEGATPSVAAVPAIGSPLASTPTLDDPPPEVPSAAVHRMGYVAAGFGIVIVALGDDPSVFPEADRTTRLGAQALGVGLAVGGILYGLYGASVRKDALIQRRAWDRRHGLPPTQGRADPPTPDWAVAPAWLGNGVGLALSGGF